MNERLKFIADWLKGDCPIIALARSYSVSRKTAHKWIRRYRTEGLNGLDELSRAPKSHPQTTPPDIEKEIVTYRRLKPFWGPRKLRFRLALLSPKTSWPSVSTFGAILKRNGLSKKRRRRRNLPPPEMARSVAQHPNDVWTADFKGWFRTQDFIRVDPLTIADLASRYLLACNIMVRPNTETVRQHFEDAFRTYGMPLAIRTDNGWPFATPGLGGLSRLSVWWIRLGILPERIRPAHPQENGSHERMHRSLKEQIAKPPQTDAATQQEASDRFRMEYNTERPHEALAMRTPDQDYRPSVRSFPNQLPDIQYDRDFQVRHVRPQGFIKWQGNHLYISETLAGEWVGLKPVADGIWTLHFGPLPLALYDVHDNKLHKLEKAEAKKPLSPMSPDQSVT